MQRLRAVLIFGALRSASSVRRTEDTLSQAMLHADKVSACDFSDCEATCPNEACQCQADPCPAELMQKSASNTTRVSACDFSDCEATCPNEACQCQANPCPAGLMQKRASKT